MEMCPTISPSALFPTIIRRDGKWVTAVPIDIAYGPAETDSSTQPQRGLWMMLRMAISRKRRLAHP